MQSGMPGFGDMLFGLGLVEGRPEGNHGHFGGPISYFEPNPEFVRLFKTDRIASRETTSRMLGSSHRGWRLQALGCGSLGERGEPLNC